MHSNRFDRLSRLSETNLEQCSTHCTTHQVLKVTLSELTCLFKIHTCEHAIIQHDVFCFNTLKLVCFQTSQRLPLLFKAFVGGVSTKAFHGLWNTGKTFINRQMQLLNCNLCWVAGMLLPGISLWADRYTFWLFKLVACDRKDKLSMKLNLRRQWPNDSCGLP